MNYKKIIFFSSYGGHNDSVRAGLLNKLKLISDLVVTASCPRDGINAAILAHEIKSSDLVVNWNGSEVGCFWVSELCKTFDVPYVVFERGLLPQQNNFIIDKEGICCRSVSLGGENHQKPKGNYDLTKVVFVCQLEWDSTVYHYSNFTNNEEFIDRYVSLLKIPVENVVVCPHPRNRNIKSKYFISKLPTIKECDDCSLAIGISSTTMYEIALLGKDVLVIGKHRNANHPINRGNSIEEIKQMILDHQISYQSTPQDFYNIIQKVLHEG